MLETLKFIWNHPLTRRRRGAAFARYLRWQVSSRLAFGPVAVPFVDGTKLLVSPGMAGATGNVYCGLHEFEEMAFVLHLLRPGDLLADVGANIGSYTLLAASRGANVIAFEPGEEARVRLEQNVGLNRFGSRVEIRREAVSSAEGEADFSLGRDTNNRLLRAGEGPASQKVQVTTLDAALAGRVPTLVKIDVEGGETEVLKGAARSLEEPGFLAVIAEVWGLRRPAVAFLKDRGFEPFEYDPFQKSVVPVTHAPEKNVVFIRDLAAAEERFRNASRISLPGLTF